MKDRYISTATLAPIVLFAYNRYDHLFRTIESLKKNELASESDLFIYCDGPRSLDDENVFRVRNFVRTIDGFKSIQIIERSENIGLANSIIQGVSEVVEKYGSVIVLEDDIVTSPYFLSFMNNALNTYNEKKNVWHISGWNYPISSNGLEESFFHRTMNCWGWGTWKDRWKYFSRNPNRIASEWTQEKIKAFNLDGYHNFWDQIEKNASGKLKTWAIFWYATIFENDGLCLNPTETLVYNSGNDGSGENCGITDLFGSDINMNRLPYFPSQERVNDLAVERIKGFYRSTKPTILKRVIRKIKKMVTKVCVSVVHR